MDRVPELRFSEFSGEWESKKLKDISSKLNVGFVGTCEKFYTDEQKGIPLIRTGNLFEGKILFNNLKFVTQEFHKKNKKSQIINGDILIARHGSNGQASLYTFSGEANTLNIVILRNNSDISNSRFLINQINSGNVRKQILKKTAGSTQGVINTKEIGKLNLILPPLPEQQKIAQFLTSVDTKTDQLTKKKTLLEQYKTGVSQKLFSQEIRFKADDGSEYPDWVEKKLGEIVNIIDGDRGKNYPKSHEYYDKDYCLFLSAKNITKNGFSLVEKQFISNEKDNLLRKGKLHKLDVVLTTRGSVGHFAYYNDDIPYENIRINSGMVLLRNKEDNINPKFLYRICKSFIIEKQIKIVSFGSAQPQLTVKEINKFKLSLPSLPEQQKIANLLSSIDTKTAQTTKQLNQTKQFKKALLQQMFI